MVRHVRLCVVDHSALLGGRAPIPVHAGELVLVKIANDNGE
jgi:hypothetical protein